MKNHTSVLEFAAVLTDDIVTQTIDRSFNGVDFESVRSWLKDALVVNPVKRWSIASLKTRHSLFSDKGATLSMSKMTTAIADSKTDVINVLNARAEQIMYHNDQNTSVLKASISGLQDEVRRGFLSLGEALSNITAQAALGNVQCKEGLATLMAELSRQREQGGSVDMATIQAAIKSMGSDLSQHIEASVSKVLAEDGHEVTQKMDLLIGMVTNMTNEVASISKTVTDLKKLTIDIAVSQTNHIPRTFVIKPKPPPVKLDSKASMLAKIGNFVNRKVASPFQDLLWDESVLVFICPVMKKEVPCGPHGRGYAITLPTEVFKRSIPALKWGFMFLKVALSTQGLGAAVPDIGPLLPSIDNEYLNSMAQNIFSSIHDNVRAEIDSATSDDAINNMFESFSSEKDEAAMECIAQFLKDQEGYNGSDPHWEPRNTGLNKVERDGRVLWLSREGEALLTEKGDAVF